MTERTSTNFADRLLDAIDRTGTPCIVGLDPRYDDIPAVVRRRFSDDTTSLTVEAAARTITAFNREVIDIIAPLVPAVKPQMAFYEVYGPAGVQAFLDTVTYAKEKGLLVIADVKRNDIGSTVAAYSQAYLGRSPLGKGKSVALFDVDAVTVNAYLGTDGIKPFLDDCHAFGKGIFVLVKTSNKSSAEFQNLLVEGEPLYVHVARKCREWGETLIGEKGFSSVGVVVGATYPEEASAVRDQLPHSIFLVPGFGFQGGNADELKRFCSHGSGIIINSSRGIVHAWLQEPFRTQFGEDGYRDAIRVSLETMIEQVRKALR